MDKKKLETALYNSILLLFDKEFDLYNGLDDDEFISMICEELGITKKEYNELMFKSNSSALDGIDFSKKEVIFEDDKVKIQTTGHDYDFIATVENKTKGDMTFFSYKESIIFKIPALDWVGILADNDGFKKLEFVIRCCRLKNKKTIK